MTEPVPDCKPSGLSDLKDIKEIKKNVSSLLSKVNSDIAVNDSRANNVVSGSSFVGSNPTYDPSIQASQDGILLGANGLPIVPVAFSYEIDPQNPYGYWGKVRPPGMHPNARYTSKTGENIKILSEVAKTIVDIPDEKDKSVFMAAMEHIQKNESGNAMGQAITYGGGFDIRPIQNFGTIKLSNKDLGPFPRANKSITLSEITSGYRPRGKQFRGDYGCWQYIPSVWLGLMKRYKPDLLRQNPDYQWCWLAPAELEMELQLRSLQDAWKNCPPNTPYVIKGTMMQMYNFLPITFEKLKVLILGLGPDEGWKAYIKYCDERIIQENPSKTILSPPNSLAYLKSIAISYKKMKANLGIAQAESYTVPEDPIATWKKHYRKGD